MTDHINGFRSKAAALRELREAGYSFTRLLGAPDSNPKVAKNMKQGVMSFPLHLAPADLSGYNTCAMASKGCKAACLHTAGNPAYMAQKEKSRIDKTRAYFSHRETFMALLAFEIDAARKKARKAGMKCGIRLNATSDIPWERVRVDAWACIMDMFPTVAFYDYTKITKRAIACAHGAAHWPVNYHLTFSKAEDNDRDVWRVLGAGGNVAIVYSPDRLNDVLEHGHVFGPRTAHDHVPVVYEAIDGDEHDFRPIDPPGHIVALKAKGDARNDTSGFVVR